ncbi:dihydrodipicolinate synthase [Halobacteroides halobius DSM 5150]|uniref:4-hydroxy-tetrahydrodipicolinate synthase n=1 Tax=Halobacteroides halobius (strain ATCC 35273 / DSM 5150 / MD-1) TaxID=748449 RepID=L0K5Z3_HALHC|nr:4-hydroxy-tetrahydrodipicolinate synthase [Halobacteroides halobius]AGB40697.1 dihydrodipicolinate synthase [Halobacteroides halobius DSM 5150]
MEFGEVLTAMVTPFNENKEVDYEQAIKLARYLIDNGSDGLLVLGTTGEVPTLSQQEKLNLLEIIIDEVGEETTVIAGTGCYSTAKSIEFTNKAERIGVDGVMLVTPYYNKPPQAGLENHFKAVAQATKLPVILYNVPSRTGRNIEPATVAKLAEIDNIVAVKEASGSVEQAAKIRALTDDSFMIYSGDDGLTLPILSIGGTGVISVASHLAGNEIKEMITAYKEGKVELAARKNAKLNELFEAVFMTTNPIPVKKALNLTGPTVGGLRAPLIELPSDLERKLKEVLVNYKLL